MKTHFSDLFWYIVIGLLVILCMALWLIYVPERYWIDEKWAAFALFSFFLFAFLTKMYWRLRMSAKFWALMLAVLTVHVLAYVPLLKYIQRASWYLIIMPIEAMLIALAIKLVLNVLPDLTTRL
ncbi:MAG: hypothetical protein WAR21_12760 [Candidatus Acidiferrales bacterium]